MSIYIELVCITYINLCVLCLSSLGYCDDFITIIRHLIKLCNVWIFLMNLELCRVLYLFIIFIYMFVFFSLTWTVPHYINNIQFAIIRAIIRAMHSVSRECKNNSELFFYSLSYRYFLRVIYSFRRVTRNYHNGRVIKLSKYESTTLVCSWYFSSDNL